MNNIFLFRQITFPIIFSKGCMHKAYKEKAFGLNAQRRNLPWKQDIKKVRQFSGLLFLVGVKRLELPTSCSQMVKNT